MFSQATVDSLVSLQEAHGPNARELEAFERLNTAHRNAKAKLWEAQKYGGWLAIAGAVRRAQGQQD